MTAKKNQKTTVLGIRLDPEQRKQIEDTANQLGIDSSQLVRLSVIALIEHYKRNGNRLVLPINFSDIVTVHQNTEEPKTKKTA